MTHTYTQKTTEQSVYHVCKFHIRDDADCTVGLPAWFSFKFPCPLW